MASIREKSPKTEYSVLVLCVFRSAENGLQGGPNQMIKVGQFRIAKSPFAPLLVPVDWRDVVTYDTCLSAGCLNSTGVI